MHPLRAPIPGGPGLTRTGRAAGPGARGGGAAQRHGRGVTAVGRPSGYARLHHASLRNKASHSVHFHSLRK
jgi:hypothetical protein